MTFDQMSKNFTNTVKSKPPLMVFTVCLLGIVVTTFCLAYYVDSQDKIPNVDVKDDWVSLLGHLNKLDVCLEKTNGPVIESTKKVHGQTFSVVSYMKATGFSTDQDLNVQGYLSLEGWSSKCVQMTKTPSHLQIEFTLLKTDQNNTKNDNICVIFTGPADFMPTITDQDSCGSAPSKTKWARLTTKSNNDKFCASGTHVKLHQDIDYSKNLNFDVFLSRADRLLINSHLIIISCLLLVVVISLTCYAFCKSRNHPGGDSKQHLMSKGMYL